LLETVAEAEEIGAHRANFFVLPADVTSEEQVLKTVRAIETSELQLRGVINSAGVAQHRRSPWPLLDQTADSWREILGTNLLGSWLVTKSAVPLMVRGAAVRVLFLSSEAGWANTAGFGQYNVTKAAVNSLGFSLAEECGRRYPDLDVQMNVLVPGEARTEMNQGSENSPYTLASMALLLLSHPKGGPNGKFFHRDGRHLEFAYSTAYGKSLSET
jgi:NAD(P)-dependent dehydrogenase (short-subunit alcohol dehydrogenase family)